MIYDVVIVGAGPAGMTAALNVRRGGKTVLLLEQENFGGQIAISPRVENIPSIKEISGEEYASRIFDQISDLGVEFELENVQSVAKKDDHFEVKTDYATHIGRSVILATGCKPRHIGVAGEEDYIGHGVSYCAVCDGAFYKDQEVTLIGDANTGLQYALLLANYCKKVHICALFDHFFADKILVERVYAKENIDVRFNVNLKRFIGDKELTGLAFEDTKTKEEIIINTKAVFIAVGQIPDNGKFAELVELDRGYIITNEAMETKTPGLFAAGDCRSKKIRQVVTAQSDASIAAIGAINYADSHQ